MNGRKIQDERSLGEQVEDAGEEVLRVEHQREDLLMVREELEVWTSKHHPLLTVFRVCSHSTGSSWRPVLMFSDSSNNIF
jgi:hypothetical protein